MGEQMKLITQLMHDDYPSYISLCKQQGNLAGEALWEELEKERMFYRLKGGLLSLNDYLCMTPFVLKRENQLFSLCNQCVQLFHGDALLSFADTIKKELMFQKMQLRKDSLLYLLLEDMYCDQLLVLFCFTLLPVPLCEEMCRLWKQLLMPNIPIDVKAFFVDPMLYKNMFVEKDKTYLFLKFLSLLELNFEECLLLLKSDCGDFLKMSKEQLFHRYPFFSKQQIAFFVTHRNPYDYYSIQEYMRYSHVCYETARIAMERFVHYKWYHRRKIGKRFYYTTLAGHSGFK